MVKGAGGHCPAQCFLCWAESREHVDWSQWVTVPWVPGGAPDDLLCVAQVIAGAEGGGRGVGSRAGWHLCGAGLCLLFSDPFRARPFHVRRQEKAHSLLSFVLFWQNLSNKESIEPDRSH